MFKVYVALDTPSYLVAENLTAQLVPYCGIKLGLEFFCRHGMDGVKRLHDNTGCNVFLDLKFYDIPTTVHNAVRAVAPYAFIDALTVHASGSEEMLKAAVEAANEVSSAYGSAPNILGVTVLTSEPLNVFQSLALADKAVSTGLDGIVCSTWTAGLISKVLGNDFEIVCPGIRRHYNKTQDHKNPATPKIAREVGATTLVVGRPITQATNPYDELQNFLQEFDNEQ